MKRSLDHDDADHPPRLVTFFDVETDGLPLRSRHPCPSDFALVQVTIACADEHELDEEEGVLRRQHRIACWRDDDDVFEPVLSAFDRADCIVAYNGAAFDMPALFKYYSRSANGLRRFYSHASKLFDPFSRVRDVTGLFCSLDSLLSTNGLSAKQGSGRDAIRFWEQNRRDELKAYCQADVHLLARLCCCALHRAFVVPTRSNASIALPRFQHDPCCSWASKGAEATAG